MPRRPTTTVLFGAFDRHNFGDLLFPHVAAALLPGRELVFAGLGERDLRPFGGHRVQALHRLAGDGRLRGAQLVHAGGEILTCTARQAAAMLLPGDAVTPTLSYLDRHPEEEPRWLRTMLGTAAAMPYVASRADLPGIERVVFDAVGGVALGALPPPWREAVLARLAVADAVAVRDATTLAQLQAAGVAAALMPDPAVMVDALFGMAIRARARRAPLGSLLAALPQGFIAVQLAADFGDDATLALVATQLDLAIEATGLGVVLFRAGAAPWHDDLGLLQRIAGRLRSPAVRVFDGLDLWDICSLLAHCRVHAGSSLHGHIVALAFGVPAIGLQRPDDSARAGKLAACAATWESADPPRLRPLAQLAEAIRAALAGDAAARLAQSARWVASYRDGFGRLVRCLG